MLNVFDIAAHLADLEITILAYQFSRSLLASHTFFSLGGGRGVQSVPRWASILAIDLAALQAEVVHGVTSDTE